MSWQNKIPNLPYADGDYYSVVVEVEHDKGFHPAIGTNNRSLPGPIGRINALRQGLLAIGDNYGKNVSRLIGTDVIAANTPYLGLIFGEGHYKERDTWAIDNPTFGIALEGPIISPRPEVPVAKYKVSVLKGFIDVPVDWWKAIEVSPPDVGWTNAWGAIKTRDNGLAGTDFENVFNEKLNPAWVKSLKRLWSGDYVDFNTPIGQTNTLFYLPTIRRNSEGGFVESAQEMLVLLNYNLGTSGNGGNGVDGKFGPRMRRAVKKFHSRNKLRADGVIGRKTWPLLITQSGYNIANLPGNEPLAEAQSDLGVTKNMYDERFGVPGSTGDHPPVTRTNLSNNFGITDLPPMPWYDKQYLFESLELVDEIKAPIGYKELQFSSFHEFDQKLEALRLNLIEYQKEHDEMIQNMYADVINGPLAGQSQNIPIDLNIIGESMITLREAMANLMALNGYSSSDLRTEPIAVGIRPLKVPAAYTAEATQERQDLLESLISEKGYIAYIRKGNVKKKDIKYGNLEQWGFLWKGAESLTNTPEASDATVCQFLFSLDEVASEPGFANAFDRACYVRPPKDEKRKNLKEFLDAYYKPGPKLVPRQIQNEKQAFKLFKAMGFSWRSAKTREEKEAEHRITKDQFFKEVIANRNRQVNRQAGDLVFQSLPNNVDKIRNLDDLWAYFINRVDITTLAVEMMACFKMKYSVDDIIDFLCDGFLKQLELDPNLMQELFERLENQTLSVDRFQIVSGADISRDIRSEMAYWVSQDVDDPFYRAVINLEFMQNRSAKRLFCETILAGIFGLVHLFEFLVEEIPDLFSDSPEKIPFIKKCDPLIKYPDSLATPEQLLAEVALYIEEKIYEKIEKVIFIPINDAIRNLIELCRQDEDYGALDPSNVIPDLSAFNRRLPTGLDRDFLTDLFAILSKNEICELFSGAPSRALVMEIQRFVKRQYDEFYSFFETPALTISFFAQFADLVDLSACNLETLRPPLADLCLDGETPRQLALRRSLAAKGLTPEEIEEQIEVDKEIGKQQAGTLASLFAFGTADKFQLDELKLIASEALRNLEVVKTQNKYAIDGCFGGIANTFPRDAQGMIPLMFNHLRGYSGEKASGSSLFNFSAQQEGFLTQYAETLDNKHPLYYLLTGTGPSSDALGFSSSQRSRYWRPGNNQHNFELWAPDVVFDPGEPSILLGATVKEGKAASLSFVSSESDIWGSVFNTTRLSLLPPTSLGTDKLDNYRLRVAFKSPNQENPGFLIDSGPKSLAPKILEAYNPFKQQFQEAVTQSHNRPYQVFCFEQMIESALRGQTLLAYEDTPTSSNTFDLIGSLEKRDPISGTDLMYDLLFEGCLINTADIFSNSRQLNLDQLRYLGFRPDKIGEMIGLPDIGASINDKIQAKMMKRDPTMMDPKVGSTDLTEALFDGCIEAIIKLAIVETIMKTVHIFDKFRIDQVFSNSVMAEYLFQTVAGTEVGISLSTPKTLLEAFEDRLFVLEEKMRLEVTSGNSKSKKLSQDEIDNKIKEEIYKGQNNAADTLIRMIEEFTSGMQSTQNTVEEFLNTQTERIEEEILSYVKDNYEYEIGLTENLFAAEWLGEGAQFGASQINSSISPHALIVNKDRGGGTNTQYRDSLFPILDVPTLWAKELKNYGGPDLNSLSGDNYNTQINTPLISYFKDDTSTMAAQAVQEVNWCKHRFYQSSTLGNIDLNAEYITNLLDSPQFKRGNFIYETYVKVKPKLESKLWSLPDVENILLNNIYEPYILQEVKNQEGDTINTEISAFLKYDDENSLGLGAVGSVHNYNDAEVILSYDAFKALSASMAGNPEWKEAFHSCKFGLRVTYVLPEDATSQISKGQMARIRATLNPVEITTTNITTGFVHYKLHPESPSIKTLSNAQREKVNKNAILNKSGYFVEAYHGATTKPVRGFFSIPLVAAEISTEDAGVPSWVDSGTVNNLLEVYPGPREDFESNHGFTMFNNLYKKLKTSKEYKFLFEYVVPYNKVLALHTIYNVRNFDTLFKLPCSPFNRTKNLIVDLMKEVEKAPGGDQSYRALDTSPVLNAVKTQFFPSIAKKLECPPTDTYVGKFINEGIPILSLPNEEKTNFERPQPDPTPNTEPES